jgi:hypothetical protein
MRGELVDTSIAALEAQIDQIGCSTNTEVVLDVAGLTRIDAVGSRVVAGLDVYVRALGARLRVTGAHGQVAEALLAASQLSPGHRADLGVRTTTLAPLRRGERPMWPPELKSESRYSANASGGLQRWSDERANR